MSEDKRNYTNDLEANAKRQKEIKDQIEGCQLELDQLICYLEDVEKAALTLSITTEEQLS